MVGLENVLEVMRDTFAPAAPQKEKRMHVAIPSDREQVRSEDDVLLDKETLCCQQATD